MKEIELSQGKKASVDDRDFEWLNQWKWYCTPIKRGTCYAARHIYIGGKRTNLFMHQLLLITPERMEIDHLDGNGLNNTRNNIRICSHAENIHNSSAIIKSSRFKGVSWHAKDKRWRAQIAVNGTRVHLGQFTDEREAAFAYNKAAVLYFGEFARLNQLEGRWLKC